MEKTKEEQRIKKKSFSIPPIALVILGAVISIVAVVLLVGTISTTSEKIAFFNTADKVKAKCVGTASYTTENTGTMHYVLTMRYTVMGTDFVQETDGTVPSMADINIGDTINIYYQSEDPTYFLTNDSRPDIVGACIFYAVLLLGGAVLAIWHLRTILRSLKPYGTALVPEDQDFEVYSDGEVDPYADTGLSDKSTDYMTGYIDRDTVTDSYADPFATYSGYQEDSPADDTPYYDPNAFYSGEEEPPPPPMYSDEDLNNPFTQNTGGDPFYREPNEQDHQ